MGANQIYCQRDEQFFFSAYSDACNYTFRREIDRRCRRRTDNLTYPVDSVASSSESASSNDMRATLVRTVTSFILWQTRDRRRSFVKTS